MNKVVNAVVLAVVLCSFGFAQETPASENTHKYKSLDMLLGFSGGGGFNMKGDAFQLEKDSYFIVDAYVGVNYDFYILYWLSASTGLYVYEIMSVNNKVDLSDTNTTLTDVMRTPIALTLPISAHVNMPRLEWLYLGAGMNFHIPLFSMIPASSGMPDTKGDPYISLPIDVGVDFKAGNKLCRILLRATPHFFEPDTLVTFGIMFQNNIKIYSKK
ncbi:MAG: hypothetical protein LBF83_02955 [Spirochaetaceae bacterium]|jgi:hypothetical protein|nr:hypothetical protein [Spirochaetaceae bacterium]